MLMVGHHLLLIRSVIFRSVWDLYADYGVLKTKKSRAVAVSILVSGIKAIL